MAYNYLESIAIKETKKIKRGLKEKEFEFVATLQHPDTGEERADGEKYIVSQPCALLGNEKEISGDELKAVLDSNNGNGINFFVLYQHIGDKFVFELYRKQP